MAPTAGNSELALIPQAEGNSPSEPFPCVLGAVPGGLTQCLLLQTFLCFCSDLIPFT